jgi:hypothetical protein
LPSMRRWAVAAVAPAEQAAAFAVAETVRDLEKGLSAFLHALMAAITTQWCISPGQGLCAMRWAVLGPSPPTSLNPTPPRCTYPHAYRQRPSPAVLRLRGTLRVDGWTA